MLYVQGLTHDETADRLNRCASTVRRDANKAITYIEEHCADALRAAGYLPKQGEEAA
jgi:DNA-directed RNA polymerase specialized sigma24 family protein